MELLLSKQAVAVYEAVIALMLIFILVRQFKKNKEIRERRKISNQKMRNLHLEEMLKNPDIESDFSNQPNPFDVQYKADMDSGQRKLSKFQIELEVRTETSVKRYLFDLNREITIGRGENNTLPLGDKHAALKSCTIFMRKKAVYAKNPSSFPILIRRGKNKQEIRKQMVKLQNGDVLIIGRTELSISLYEN